MEGFEKGSLLSLLSGGLRLNLLKILLSFMPNITMALLPLRPKFILAPVLSCEVLISQLF